MTAMRRVSNWALPLLGFMAAVANAATSPSVGRLVNELAGHPSPYLAMHGQDPVDWQLWGRDVFERARRENKLVYVSIGYFSCHWCHVMQRESYRNPKIAAILNSAFIPVKVDRELQPALDSRLIEFVQSTQGYSGWPLNVFITPEGYPLLGFVYLPPDDFRNLLTKLDQRWRSEATNLRNTARNAAEALAASETTERAQISEASAQELKELFIDHALSKADEMEGGFGGPNKFPSVPQLRAMLRFSEGATPSRQRLRDFLVLTLDNMMARGLRDQLRGGFFRYVVDPGWHVPHFEKMLYDNALLAQLYLEAGQRLGRTDYTAVARDTLDFMLHELRGSNGALVASLSAIDDQGVEGGYYVWSKEQLQRTLTDAEFNVVRALWHLQGPPTVDAGYLPMQLNSIKDVAESAGVSVEQLRARLESARDKLIAVQRTRHVPRDTKQLAGWNGLALRAFARAAAQLNEPRYRDAAAAIRAYLVGELWDGKRLLRARTDHGAIGEASLEDYAYVGAGLLAWAQYSDDSTDYRLARRILNAGWKRFYRDTGWVVAEGMLIRYAPVEPVISDGPMPSPSAVLVDASLRLASAFDDSPLKQKALSALRLGHDTLRNDPYWFATEVRAMVDALDGLSASIPVR